MSRDSHGAGRSGPPPVRGATEVVVFGRRAVREALASPGVEPLEVRVSADWPKALRKEIAQRCREAGLVAEVAPASEIHALSGEPRHDQGIAMRVRLLGVEEIESFVAGRTGRGARAPCRLLAFDGVTNSQNIGMMVRSAVAAGMSGVVWPMVGAPWVNGLAIKASASALYRCKVLRCESLPLSLGLLRGAGFEIVGLVGRGGEDLFDLRPAHRSVFVVGSETAGLSEDVLSLLDRQVSIPMAAGIESLNVAVAASLVCFQCQRASPRA